MSLDPQELEAKFSRWISLVSDMHEAFAFTKNDEVAFTPLKKPLASSRLALVSTAGVHLKSQPSFDLAAHEGDWSYREIPWDTPEKDILISHIHYDTSAAEADVNTVFPIGTARELLQEGFLGGLSSCHLGLMGFVPDGRPLRDETAPRVASRLLEEGVDVAFLSPG